MNRIGLMLAAACLLATPSFPLHAEPEASPFDMAKDSAAKGDACAQYRLGRMYHDGEGTPKDMDMAFAWFEKSARQGYAPAQVMLGIMYEHLRLDKEKAFECYKEAALRGDAKGQYLTGSSYERGFGTQKDIKEAWKWYERACRNGNGNACDAMDRLK